MRDKLVWLSHFRHLVNELEECWETGTSSGATGSITLREPKVATFVYGYSTFSGQWGDDRVSVTIAHFPDAITTKMNPGDHMEVLCLTLRRPFEGFVSLRHTQWNDRLLAKFPQTLMIVTDDERIDQEYFVEAKTDGNKRTVRSGEFGRIINRLPVMSSFAIRDTGISVSIPIEKDSQLSTSYVEKVWSDLVAIAELAQ